MSVKIKINWDNENVVSESVRIYRADSIFTPTSLPPLLTEIFGDIYEYEDTATIDGNTYFYMLSAKLGEQEVFTECFEVVADVNVVYDVVFPKITSASTNLDPVLSTGSIQRRGLQVSANGKLGVLYGDTNQATQVFTTITPYVFDDATSTIAGTWIDSSKGPIVLSLSFFNKGMDVIVTHNSPWSITHYKLNQAYRIDLGTTEVVTFIAFDGISGGSFFINEEGTKLYRYTSAFVIYAYTLSTPHNIQTATLDYSLNISEKLTGKPSTANAMAGFAMSSDGAQALVMYTNSTARTYGRIVSLQITTPFDLRTAIQSGVFSPNDSAFMFCNPISIREKDGVYYFWCSTNEDSVRFIKRYSFI